MPKVCSPETMEARRLSYSGKHRNSLTGEDCEIIDRNSREDGHPTVYQTVWHEVELLWGCTSGLALLAKEVILLCPTIRRRPTST